LLERENDDNDKFSFFNEDDLIVYSPGTDISESDLFDENISQSIEDAEEEANFSAQPEVPASIFLQHENCCSTCKDLPQCRECTKDDECDKYACRFYEFRKIEKLPDGTFKVAGFLDPHINPILTGR
jgi:hypothetical protein